MLIDVGDFEMINNREVYISMGRITFLAEEQNGIKRLTKAKNDQFYINQLIKKEVISRKKGLK